MTENEIANWKKKIDAMPHAMMARLWRFSGPGASPLFDKRNEISRRFIERYEAAGGMTPAISKFIGLTPRAGDTDTSWGAILRASVEDVTNNRDDVARVYAASLEDKNAVVEFGSSAQAIIKRWSFHALDYIVHQAWKISAGTSPKGANEL